MHLEMTVSCAACFAYSNLDALDGLVDFNRQLCNPFCGEILPSSFHFDRVVTNKLFAVAVNQVRLYVGEQKARLV